MTKNLCFLVMLIRDIKLKKKTKNPNIRCFLKTKLKPLLVSVPKGLSDVPGTLTPFFQRRSVGGNFISVVF